MKAQSISRVGIAITCSKYFRFTHEGPRYCGILSENFFKESFFILENSGYKNIVSQMVLHTILPFIVLFPTLTKKIGRIMWHLWQTVFSWKYIFQICLTVKTFDSTINYLFNIFIVQLDSWTTPVVNAIWKKQNWLLNYGHFQPVDGIFNEPKTNEQLFLLSSMVFSSTEKRQSSNNFSPSLKRNKDTHFNFANIKNNQRWGIIQLCALSAFNGYLTFWLNICIKDKIIFRKKVDTSLKMPVKEVKTIQEKPAPNKRDTWKK